MNEALRAVSLLQILEQSFTQRFTVSNFTFLQSNEGLDDLFREDRVAFDLHVADAIELAVNDRHRDSQRVIDRRNEWQRQDRETSATFAQAFDARFAVAGLQIAFRSHVGVDLMQIVFQLLPIENVLLAKASNQSRFLHVLHARAQRPALENFAAFELNLGDAHARAFVDYESDGAGSC